MFHLTATTTAEKEQNSLKNLAKKKEYSSVKCVYDDKFNDKVPIKEWQ